MTVCIAAAIADVTLSRGWPRWLGVVVLAAVFIWLARVTSSGDWRWRWSAEDA